MEHSHWTVLQTVYPPDQIKTINWASLNKHIHNSLDLLRQSANSLNELSHTTSSSQNLPLWTCLLTDLSYLQLKIPIGYENDKNQDGAVGVVPQHTSVQGHPKLPLSHGVTCHLPNSAAHSAQRCIYPYKPRQLVGLLPGNFLKLICYHDLPAIRKTRNGSKYKWSNKSLPSPLAQWFTKKSQTSFFTPSLNISFEFWANDFSFEQINCWVNRLNIRHSTQ